MLDGNVDFLIGIKYLRYFPQLIFQLPSGLAIYKSVFQNADGGYGVIGGPHEVFTAIEQNGHHFNQKTTFFTDQFNAYQNGYQVYPDVSLLGFTTNNIAEETGTDVSYRCVKCRSYKACKDQDHNEAVSIKEEVEQDVINRSVRVNIAERTTTARLPFIHDAKLKLYPNKHKALSIYKQQIKKLNNNPRDKKSRPKENCNPSVM